MSWAKLWKRMYKAKVNSLNNEIARLKSELEFQEHREETMGYDYFAEFSRLNGEVVQLSNDLWLAREALKEHIEAYGDKFHEEDCDFDTHGGQHECSRCVANAMANAVLLENAE